MEIEIKATVSKLYKTDNPKDIPIEELKAEFLEDFADICIGALISGKVDIEVRK